MSSSRINFESGLLVGSLVCGISAVSIGIFWVDPPAEDAVSQLSVLDPDRDLGTAYSGEVLETTFVLCNESATDDLQILSVVPTCGCSVPRLQNSRIPCGESESLLVFTKVGEELGATTQRVRLSYQNVRSGAIQELSLTLRVRVQHSPEVEPDRLTFEIG